MKRPLDTIEDPDVRQAVVDFLAVGDELRRRSADYAKLPERDHRYREAAQARINELTSRIAVRAERLGMTTQLPNEASLTRMFDAMLWTAGHEDSSGELARTLAVLLPSALAGTTGEFSGEALDPDFRPLRGARVPRQTRARPPRKQ